MADDLPAASCTRSIKPVRVLPPSKVRLVSFTSARRTAEVDATAVSMEMSQLAAVAIPRKPSEVTAISLWLHAADELWGTREPNCCRGGVLVSFVEQHRLLPQHLPCARSSPARLMAQVRSESRETKLPRWSRTTCSPTCTRESMWLHLQHTNHSVCLGGPREDCETTPRDQDARSNFT